MYQVPITAVPNQSISFNVDGGYWALKIYQSIQHVCMDISLGGAYLINGVRCFPGIPMMPYPYMHEPLYGNFVFDNIVDWTNFGVSCNLYYLELDEWLQFKELGYLAVND